MTGNLRTLAEAEAEADKRFIESPLAPENETYADIFVEGFIAGRTSVTREQIEQVIEREVDLALSSRLVLADAILALLNGDTDD